MRGFSQDNRRGGFLNFLRIVKKTDKDIQEKEADLNEMKEEEKSEELSVSEEADTSFD